MEVLITVLVTLQITENFLCNFFNDAVSTADYIPVGDWVIDELERIWKAAVRTELRYYVHICLEGLEKTTNSSIRVTGVLAKI